MEEEEAAEENANHGFTRVTVCKSRNLGLLSSDFLALFFRRASGSNRRISDDRKKERSTFQLPSVRPSPGPSEGPIQSVRRAPSNYPAAESSSTVD